MDIANINALTRSGSYPTARPIATVVPQRAAPGATREAIALARGQQAAEQVLQGELLQKRRATAAYDTADLLESMRNMDRMLRDTAGIDTAPARDVRRAIASYTQQTIIPGTRSGAAASGSIDFFV